jgi:hypothetical protein
MIRSRNCLGAALLAASAAWGGGLYLVQGRGLEGKVEIGGPVPRTATAPVAGWFRAGELEFRTATGDRHGPIVLIRCQQATCLTDRIVLVGSDESEVLRRYGAPQERSESEQGALLRYRGVGFLVVSGKVSAIYILPP